MGGIESVLVFALELEEDGFSVKDIGLEGWMRDGLAFLEDGGEFFVRIEAFSEIVEGFDERKLFVEILEALLALGVLEGVFCAFEGEQVFAFIEGIEFVDAADGSFDDLGIGFAEECDQRGELLESVVEALCAQGEGGERLFFVEVGGLAGFRVLVSPCVFVGVECFLSALP